MSTRQEILSNDYEPYDNRVRPGQTNRFESLVHLTKGLLGTGILALGDAFKNAGFIPGVVGCVVLTILSTYSIHILFDSMYFFCKRDQVPLVTFSQAFKEGLKMGPKCFRKCADFVPVLVNFFIITNQVGCICVYNIFCASNIKQVVDIHTAKGSAIFSVETYIIFMLPFFMLICYIRNLKKLAPYSNIANWLTLIGLLFIYYFLFQKIEPISERKLFAPIRTLPLFMGTCIFAVMSIGSILTVEMNMKDGRQWGSTFGVLNVSMFLVTLLNIFTGFCGYWKYGEHVEGVITLNISIDHPLGQGIRILFSAAIYVSYALQAYPATEILWEQYIAKYMVQSKHQLLWEYTVRTCLVLFAFLLGIAIPHISLFISLIGAFCLASLGIVFPPFMDFCIRWPNEYGKGNIILYRDIALILFGLSGWGFGTYCALLGIVNKFLA